MAGLCEDGTEPPGSLKAKNGQHGSSEGTGRARVVLLGGEAPDIYAVRAVFCNNCKCIPAIVNFGGANVKVVLSASNHTVLASSCSLFSRRKQITVFIMIVMTMTVFTNSLKHVVYLHDVYQRPT
ncbi:hypothetical protein ANN_09627 [Periplaneta americana]|uniref:Uncharacterized protein n=1 Tax=Periplaneta americana TaxID=6978 RepID=A0ABQ8TPF2_PERAM|nr:hypothetical protein ANN_09627 [Periplaneta americana]